MKYSLFGLIAIFFIVSLFSFIYVTYRFVKLDKDKYIKPYSIKCLWFKVTDVATFNLTIAMCNFVIFIILKILAQVL